MNERPRRREAARLSEQSPATLAWLRVGHMPNDPGPRATRSRAGPRGVTRRVGPGDRRAEPGGRDAAPDRRDTPRRPPHDSR